MDDKNRISDCTGFDWDQGNIEKNWAKHKTSPFECEQVFFNQPLFVVEDLKHSQRETRYYALGRTDNQRLLFVVFMIRKSLIRVISGRDMSRKERKAYEEKQKADTEI